MYIAPVALATDLGGPRQRTPTPWRRTPRRMLHGARSVALRAPGAHRRTWERGRAPRGGAPACRALLVAVTQVPATPCLQRAAPQRHHCGQLPGVEGCASASHGLGVPSHSSPPVGHRRTVWPRRLARRGARARVVIEAAHARSLGRLRYSCALRRFSGRPEVQEERGCMASELAPRMSSVVAHPASPQSPN